MAAAPRVQAVPERWQGDAPSHQDEEPLEPKGLGSSGSAAGAGGAGAGAGGSKERLHFVDWMRLLMVMGVVYAHTAVSGAKGNGGFTRAWMLDDRTLYYDPKYEWVLPDNPNKIDGPAPYAVRWISVIRQWCLPLLFWVSGAAVACSYRGGVPRGLDKLFVFSVVGMGLNAALWFLSPQEKACIIDKPECRGRGVLFDFSICGQGGWWFAIIFQMWYTVVLFCLSLINWPLFAVAYGTARAVWLTLQWLLNMVLYTTLVLLAGSVCPDPVLVLVELGVLEAVFLVVVALDVPLSCLARPEWLPVRVVHYMLAGVVMLQFGFVPYAANIEHIGPAYLAFMVTGFNRFFDLGFLMTHDRTGPGGDKVKPAWSRVWPVTLIWLAFVSPSTNWDQAGMLTYPFFTKVLDRCLYVAGALTTMFILDRVSRHVKCKPLPDVLGNTSMLLYLCHPWLITVLLAVGFRTVMGIWVTSVVTALLLVAGVGFVRDAISRQADKAADDASDQHSQCSSQGQSSDLEGHGGDDRDEDIAERSAIVR